MKIAILTLPLHTNYGGILQAFALQTILERKGHQVEVLQKIPTLPHSRWLMPLAYAKRSIKKFLLGKGGYVFFESRQFKEKPIQEQETSKFVNKYIHLRYIKKLNDVNPGDYDGIVVGSDQVWRKLYFVGGWNCQIKNAFLSFTKGWNIKRIAYAASFGLNSLSEYTSKDIKECKNSINFFDEVSVRETSGVDICKNVLGVNALQLLDPTMLLSKDDYISLIDQSTTKPSQGNLLCYILDKTPFKEKVVTQISQERNLIPFFSNVEVDNFSKPIGERIQPPVEQWLRGFMDAECIITDSFHACVFSIIFQKPFIVIGNKNRGMARFTSLLKSFDLEDRLIDETSGFSSLEDLPTNLLSKVEYYKAVALEYLNHLN